MAKKKFIKKKICKGVRGGRLPSVFNKEQLVTMLHNTNDSRTAMVIFTGIFQGLRISEMWKLKWKDVDLSTGMIIVRDAKNVKRFETGYGKDRYVPVTRNLAEVTLKKAQRFLDWVKSKTWTAQVNEVLCKIICHNVCCVIQEMHELGIKGNFLNEGVL